MEHFVALLRAVNVGGTGKLPMQALVTVCTDAGFEDVRTYLASGNVVFTADGSTASVQAALESRLEAYAGAPLGVFVRTAAEMSEVLDGNPFAEREPNRTVAIFLDGPPPEDVLARVTGASDREEIHLGKREIYVHYGRGISRSKLKIPAAAVGTARNINTVTALVAMAATSR